jgi:GNAT superfamily N-acetyltransferase
MSYRIQAATGADVEIIAGHRRAMFADMGLGDERGRERMTEAFRPWLASRLASGEYLGWFALTAEGAVAGGAGLWLMPWPPHMTGLAARGNILNVYTEPAHRRRGVARMLMNAALDWCRANQVTMVILHASDEGRALYAELGFAATNEMRLVLG